MNRYVHFYINIMLDFITIIIMNNTTSNDADVQVVI